VHQIADIVTAGGIAAFGVCDFAHVKAHLLPCCAVQELPQNPRSIISCVFPYHTGCTGHNVARIAVVRDYHQVVMALLQQSAAALKQQFPKHEFACFADNSPIPEVEAAVQAGLGVRGQNRLLITPQYGSWVVLGEIVTDLPLSPAETEAATCQNCGACVAGCPSGALGAGEMTRCLSKISQKKGELTPQERQLLAENQIVWGCDRCQEACPMNRNARQTDIAAFLDSQIPVVNQRTDIADRMFAWRGSKTILRNLQL